MHKKEQKKMKKTQKFLSLLALLLVGGVTSCTSDPSSVSPSSPNSSVSSSTPGSSTGDKPSSSSPSSTTPSSSLPGSSSSSSSSSSSTPEPEPVLYDIAVGRNLSESVFSVSVVPNAEAGDLVSVGFVSKSSYGFSSYEIQNFYLHVVSQEGEEVLRPMSTEAATEVYFAFTMPESDVTLYAASATNTIDETSGFTLSFEMDEELSVIGYSQEEKYSAFYGYMVREPGYRIDKMEYHTNLDGADVWHAFSPSDYAFDHNYFGFYLRSYTFDYATEVTIRVEGKHVGTKKITYVDGDKVKVDSAGGILPTEATPGDTVAFTYSINYANHFIPLPPTIQGVPEEDILNNNTYQVEFIMPENDVTIAFSLLENQKITVDYDEDLFESVQTLSYGTPVTSLPPNAMFDVVCVPKEGYVVTSAVMNEETIPFSTVYNAADGSYTFSFHMPAPYYDESLGEDWEPTIEDYKIPANIVLEAKVGYEVALSETTEEGVSLSFPAGRSSYGEGETVSFGLSVPKGKQIQSIVAKGEDGKEIEVTFDGTTRTGSFVMPSGKVGIEVVLEDAEMVTVVVDPYDKNCVDSTFTISSSTVTNSSFPGPDGGTLNLQVGEEMSITFMMLYSPDYSTTYACTIVASYADGSTEDLVMKADHGMCTITFTVKSGLNRLTLVFTEIPL